VPASNARLEATDAVPLKLCGTDRCPNFADYRGYCRDCYRDRERERSARRRVKGNAAVYNRKMWAQRRRQVLASQPVCAVCDANLATEVDHVVPLDQGGSEYDPGNLQPICSPCHIEKTRRESRESPQRRPKRPWGKFTSKKVKP
jgi:5-methylcytosine-specific restriction protein A